MLTFMVAFTSIVVVGAASTMRMVSGVQDIEAIEKPAAVNFIRYGKAVRCYAKANPAWTGEAPETQQLKATSFDGVPCLHAAFNEVVDFRAFVTATHVMIYQPSHATIRGGPVPMSAITQLTGSIDVNGIVDGNGVSIRNPYKGVVGTLPPELQALPTRPGAGAPVWIAPR